MQKKYFKSQSAFTLVELLIVIAIIGILATMAVVSLLSARVKANDTKRVYDITQIKKALDLYYFEEGKYPEISEIAANLEEATAGVLGGGQITTPDGITYMYQVPEVPAPVGVCVGDTNKYTYTKMADDCAYLTYCVSNDDLAVVDVGDCEGYTYSGSISSDEEEVGDGGGGETLVGGDLGESCSTGGECLSGICEGNVCVASSGGSESVESIDCDYAMLSVGEVIDPGNLVPVYREQYSNVDGVCVPDAPEYVRDVSLALVCSDDFSRINSKNSTGNTFFPCREGEDLGDGIICNPNLLGFEIVPGTPCGVGERCFAEAPSYEPECRKPRITINKTLGGSNTSRSNFGLNGGPTLSLGEGISGPISAEIDYGTNVFLSVTLMTLPPATPTVRFNSFSFSETPTDGEECLSASFFMSACNFIIDRDLSITANFN